jgi:hypothetical protein
MAHHVHRQIREAAAAALTGLASTGANVYTNRLYPLNFAALPALRVSLDDEQAEPTSVHAPVILQRTAVLVVECCVQADDDSLDDTCDQMAKEVETALAAGLTVAGRHLDTLFIGSRFDDEAGGLDAAVKRLEFRIEFFTPANAPDTLT